MKTLGNILWHIPFFGFVRCNTCLLAWIAFNNSSSNCAYWFGTYGIRKVFILAIWKRYD